MAQSFPQLPTINPDVLAVGSEQQIEARMVANAHAQIEFTREYLRRMNAPKFPTFDTAPQFLAWVIERGTKVLQLEEGREFTLDGENLEVYQNLASYFTGDYQIWPCSLDRRKGLLIFGRYGCGKSLMMRLFGQNPRQSFRIVSSRAIAEDYRLNNDMAPHKAAIPNYSSSKFFGHSVLGLCIDDMGAESERSNYGNVSNVIAEIIQDRYDIPALRGPMTHIVTNATPKQLRKAYGERVYDRLRGLFNIVEFPEDATSRR